MIIHPGDDLEIAAVVEHDPAHDVHLPQLHGPVPLPAPELVTPLLAPSELDEVVALEAPIDARAPRQWIDPFASEFVKDAPRSPSGMQTPDLADQRFELGWDLVAAAVRSMRPIGQGQHTAVVVPGDPPVNRLTRNTEMFGNLRDLPAILEDRHDCLIALIHDTDLH